MSIEEMMKKYKGVAAGGLAVVLFGAFSLTEEKTVPPKPAPIKEIPVTEVAAPLSSEEAESAEVTIDIKGAVERPGIYKMQADERVNDAINKAGGLTQAADSAAVNLAQKVQDEMVIYVPAAGEEEPPAVALPGPAGNSGENAALSGEAEEAQVNINAADAAGLQELPGIGEAKAKAIIEYRETEGPFKAAEDLKKIPGIGDKTFEKLEPLIDI